MSVLDRLRVVLVETSHPGNIGAAARAVQTMGLSRLVLVRPRRFPHPEATAMASGAARVLDRALVAEALSDAIAGCTMAVGFTARPREFAGRVAAVREACLEAVAHATAGEVALVFGTEMSGLSNEDLARCSLVATIPADPVHASLNLAAAVQVAAYEARVAAAGAAVWRPPRFEPATTDGIEALHDHARATLVAMGFLDPGMPKRLMPRLRRLFARAGLEKEEVNILRGILAGIDRLAARRPDRPASGRGQGNS